MLVLLAAAGPAPLLAADMFPAQRPSSGPQAIDALAAAAQARDCLTPELRRAATHADQLSATQRRAAAWLHGRTALAESTAIERDEGLVVRRTPAATMRLAALTVEERADRLAVIVAGVLDARRALSGIGLPSIEPDVVLDDLGSSTAGYTVRAAGSPDVTLVLDVETPRAALYRTAAHQYAHGVTQSLSADFPAAWGEALAVWTTLRALRVDRGTEYAAIDERLNSMHVGLVNEDLVHATGNAVWLTHLESRWGMPAVRTTVEELARGGDIAAALERGIRRVSTERLPEAFADFQLWSLFTGERDDTLHLLGAGRMSAPRFAASGGGLPLLSIRREPPVAPWGGSRIRLFDGAAERGGLRVDFEGDLSARWAADLILTSSVGAIHRIPLELTEGRVEITVPLDGLSEAVLLVRRVDADDSTPRGYSYSAHRLKDYPFELAEASIEPIGQTGLLVQWETTHEHRLIGFNVLRARIDGGAPIQVNPVWIPALGAPDRGVGYRFVDPTAEPGVRYEYTIQAITEIGLTSHSGSLPASRD